MYPRKGARSRSTTEAVHSKTHKWTFAAGRLSAIVQDMEITERLRRLERAARPLEPGAAQRKKLRNAVVGSSERFLRGVDTLEAYVETEDKGIGLLGAPISEDGISLEAAIGKVEDDVIRPGAAAFPA